MRHLKITQSITNRESESLDKYLQEINKIPLISPQEEVRLAVLIREGDRTALHKLVNANLRFVVSVSKQYQNQGLPLSDLINEGNLGLITAAQRFDETKGFRFISYAIWWIRQSIMQAVTEQARLIRVPLNRSGMNSKINKAFKELEQQNEREPSPEELADLLNMDLNDVLDTMNGFARHTSIDSPVSEGEEVSLVDILENGNADKADAKMVHNQSLNIELDRSLQSLSHVQKKVICYCFGIGIDRPLTLEDIGGKLKLSSERIRQIRDKAILKIKSSQHSSVLRTFL